MPIERLDPESINDGEVIESSSADITDEALAAEMEEFGLDAALEPLKPDEGIPEVLTEEKIDSEPSEQGLETDPEAPALEDRLKEFEIPEKPEKPSLRDELSMMHLDLQREASELQQNFLSGLPQLKTQEGRSIYEMDQNDINSYIIELQDSNKAFEAAQVQTNYFEALKAADRYQQKVQGFEAKKQKFQEANDFVDWTEIKAEVAEKLPELTQEDFDKVGQYIDNQATTDPVYYAALSTKAGKLQKGVEALNTLGIIAKLKEARKTDAMPQEEAPSAPDANLSSKKVKTKTGPKDNSYDKVANSSLAEFKRLPKEDIDAALEAEMQPLLNRLGL